MLDALVLVDALVVRTCCACNTIAQGGPRGVAPTPCRWPAIATCKRMNAVRKVVLQWDPRDVAGIGDSVDQQAATGSIGGECNGGVGVVSVGDPDDMLFLPWSSVDDRQHR